MDTAWMDDSGREDGLKPLLDLVRGGRMVEVGSYAGWSTCIFAKYMLSVCAVDSWELGYDAGDPASSCCPMAEIEAIFDRRTKPLENVFKMKMSSLEASHKILDGSQDFVYIDATHTYEAVKQDSGLWLPKVKAGGSIGGHDYVEGWPGVMKAVQEVLGVPEVVSAGNWIVRVKGA